MINSFAMMTGVAILAILGSAIAGVVPAAFPAPLVAAAVPAAIGYAKAVPYNIPPYASRVDISTRNLAAPYVAAPVVAAPAPALPYAALPSAPFVAAPGPVIPSAYSGSLAAPLHAQAYAYAPESLALLG